MLEKYQSIFFLILLLAVPQFALAQQLEESKGRDVLIKKAIADLDSNDIKVAAQAAIDLGLYRATEAVPKMLQVLQSSRLLNTTEHVIAKDKNSLTEWVRTDVRDAIVNSLGLIGDKRAVAVLKKYLKRPLRNREVFTGNVARALYLITGRSYEYIDYDGLTKLHIASSLTEEEFRKRARPDLKPTAGLTASLEIAGHDPSGEFWIANSRMNIRLAITNHSKRAIEIDASKDSFVFSSVSGNGKRTDTPASLLPSPTPSGAGLVVIGPGQKFTLTWVVELKDSSLSVGWSGYVNIKCVHINSQSQRHGIRWRGGQLVSNSVERFYYF